MTIASPDATSWSTPLNTSYLDETALIFRATSLTASQFPSSIFIPGIALTFASDINLACNSVHARRGDLLVFLPASRICRSLTELFTLAREVHPDQALFGVLERDRKLLLKRLESESFLIMQPKSVSKANSLWNEPSATGFCTCPNLPEDILADGFEDIP